MVGGIGCWLSSFTLAVTEVTERAELPWLTLSYSDLITGRGFKYIFQTSLGGGAQANNAMPAIMKLAEASTGKKPATVAIVMDNTASSVAFAKQLHGKELSYINLLDADAALSAVKEMAGPTVCIVKHATPCGYAIGPDAATAWPSDRAIPPNTPAAYPQPLSRHQYQRKTFGGRIPAASVPNIQRNAVLIEVPK